MPEIPVPLLPMRGWHTASSPQEQPQGTTRSMRNVFPRDWADSGVMRLAQRPGLSRITEDPIVSGQPINAIEVQALAGFAASMAGTTEVLDSFTRTTTTGNVGTDWDEVSGTDTSKSSARTFPWLSSIPTALCNGSSVVDNQNANISATDPISTIAYYTPAISGLDTMRMGLRCKMTLNPNLGVANGWSTVGLVFFSDAASLPDGAFVVYIDFHGSTTGTVFAQFNTSPYSTANNPFYIGHESGSISVLSSPATLDARIVDDICEIRVNGNLVYTVFYRSKEIVGGETPVDVSNTDFGLYIANVGSAAASFTDDFTSADVNTGTDRITLTGHGVVTGFGPVQVSLQGGATVLPTGLAITTDYWLIVVDVDTVKVASTLGNAMNGSAIDISSVGTSGAGTFRFSSVNVTKCVIGSVDDFEVYSVDDDSHDQDYAIVAVSDNDVYQGDIEGEFSLMVGGTDAAVSAREMVLLPGLSMEESTPSGALLIGSYPYIYGFDGVTYSRGILAPRQWEEWSAQSGTVPASFINPDNKCDIAVEWDRRLVMAVGSAVHMSAIADWKDWDITPTNRDGTEAYSITMPFQVTCLISIDEGVLAICGANEVRLMVGNPALAGRLEKLDGTSGCVGRFAWEVDDQGNGYYVGLDGLYVLPKGSLSPFCLSRGRIDDYFAGIEHETQDVRLLWSRKHRGLFVFITPKIDGEAGTHLFWRASSDFERDAGDFWPFDLPAAIGPTCCCYMPSEEAIAEDRVLLGGEDGRIYQLDDEASDDDDEIVDAYVDCILASGTDTDAMLERVEMVIPESSNAVSYELRRGQSVEDALAADALSDGTLPGDGRLRRIQRRARGNCVVVRLKNNAASERMAVSSATAYVNRAGRTQERRK